MTKIETGDWTTRLPDEYTRPYGVSLGIPECELQAVHLTADGEPIALVNRPQQNRNVRHWLRFACKEAATYRAFLMLSCNTAEQLARAARIVAKRLPDYQRIALERMYEASTRTLDGLH